MRRAAFVIGAGALAMAMLHCSLLVDTSGLSGGAKPSEGGALANADGASLANDAAMNGEAGGDGGVGSSSNALGPLWLAYGTTTGKLGVRPWDSSASMWAAEQAGPNVGGDLVHWVVPKETPFGSFVAVASAGAGGAHLDVFERAADGTWTLGFTVPIAAPTRRAFDIEYETAGNTLLVVYADGAAAAPQYRLRTASGWSAPAAAPTSEAASPAWIELARNPITNEIALVFADEGLELAANIWDGTAWGTPQELDTGINAVDFKCFDAAYENGSGRLLVAWGNYETVDGGTTLDLRYTTRAIGGGFDPTMITKEGTPPGPLVLAAEPNTNRIALSYLEYNCNKSDEGCDDYVAGVWNGSAFVTANGLDGNTTTLYHSRPASMPTGVAWLGPTGIAVAAYHRDLAADATQLAFTRFDGASTWSAVAGAAAPPALPARASMQLVTAPGPMVVAIVEDTAGSLWAKGYRETAGNGVWSDVGNAAPLASALLTSSGVPFGATTP